MRGLLKSNIKMQNGNPKYFKKFLVLGFALCTLQLKL